ncbi:MAG: RAD55 family ATPase [Candidatus Thiodiazotropha lotti]|nr:RAD55 family ATPase [Candidatus Thiodiazotropha lotti]
MYKKSSIPYGESIGYLTECIFNALLICCELDDERKIIREDDEQIKSCFNFKSSRFPYKKNGLNDHINQKRLATLTVQSFNLAQKLKASARSRNAKFLPSPLYILITALTVPEEPHTKAYALAACRSYLYHQIQCYPQGYLTPKNTKSFSIQEIEYEYESLKNYKAKRDNIPINSKPEHIILTNFLAMKGIYMLRFGSTGKTERSRMTMQETKTARLGYCEEQKLYHFDSSTKGINPEFRLSDSYDDIASYSEVFNQLWGIPVSIRGFSTLFHGGIRTALNGGLVLSVSGAPGTGKTSFALAFANALSGMGGSCYYLSVEENPSDLLTKLTSLIPAYFRKLSIYNKDVGTWFFPQQLNISEINLENFTTEHLVNIKRIIDQTRDINNEKTVPALCPLIVVIDSLTGFLSDDSSDIDYQSLELFVSACRELNVIVILLSSDEIINYSKLEYLVDTVIKLRHINTDAISSKPRRIYELLKTRKQSSRPGSHIFHIEGDKGFRLSPQLPSQIDKKQNLSRTIPSDDSLIHVFNIWDEKGTDIKSDKPQYNYLSLRESSQILLHGLGSTGKAALGLKILTMPIIRNGKRPRTPQRVLVISFLYPSDYYQRIAKSLRSLRTNIYPRLVDAEVDCKYFYPGYLTPEDFVNKITRAIEIAVINGKPYTGVLLDGVHNVFLQFPSLQESDMVWPMLYNVLARSGLTTVTTFTTFAVNDYSSADKINVGMNLERHVPFLHALVQASDYMVIIEKDGDGQNLIRVENTLTKFKYPELKVYWDDQDYVIKADEKTMSSVSINKISNNKDLFGNTVID